ncbi:hypothetical protein D3C74_351280 [compost metagenome]
MTTIPSMGNPRSGRRSASAATAERTATVPGSPVRTTGSPPACHGASARAVPTPACSTTVSRALYDGSATVAGEPSTGTTSYAANVRSPA